MKLFVFNLQLAWNTDFSFTPEKQFLSLDMSLFQPITANGLTEATTQT